MIVAIVSGIYYYNKKKEAEKEAEQETKTGIVEFGSIYMIKDYKVGSELADNPNSSGFCNLQNILTRKGVERWAFNENNPRLAGLTEVVVGLTLHLPYLT